MSVTKSAHLSTIGALLACTVLTISIGAGFYNPLQQSDTAISRARTLVHAKAAVKRRLIAPSTASFPWSTREYRVYMQGDNGTVQGYVDAENGFGATVRQRWRVTFENTVPIGVSFY